MRAELPNERINVEKESGVPGWEDVTADGPEDVPEEEAVVSTGWEVGSSLD